MMGNFELWKLAADIALVTSLVALCYRFARSPGNGIDTVRLAQLEASLKTLIGSAQSAGNSLNDELLRRQNALEKLLFELESTEQRLHKAVDTSEDQKRSLDRLIHKANAINLSAASSASRASETAPMAAEVESPLMDLSEPVPAAAEPPSFEAAQQSLQRSQWGQVNIYGEPIARTEDRPAPARPHPYAPAAAREKDVEQGIHRSVQKEVEASPTRAGSDGIQDVYAAAEALLKAGRDLNYVATRTRLPVEEVRMLSQMVTQEEAVRTTESAASTEDDTDASSSDPRLGVLGTGIRRHRATL